jgi:two-component system, chemotaxis family, sensor kinase CheA
MDLNQFKKTFLEEASERLTSLDNTLIELEKDAGNTLHINEAFRAMHTIKGGAGMYGYAAIVEVTHAIESLYDQIRHNGGQVPQSLIDITLSAADHIRDLLEDEDLKNEELVLRHKEMMTAINSLFGNDSDTVSAEQNKKHMGGDPAGEGVTKTNTWNILFYPDEQIIKRAINLTYVFHDLAELGECHISSEPYEADGRQMWSALLISDRPFEEIEGVFLFVLDYCTIIKLADFDIFDSEQFLLRDERLGNKEHPMPDAIKEEGSKLASSSSLKRENSKVRKEGQSFTRINVEAGKLDHLMYLVSELVTTKSELIVALEKSNMEKALSAAEKIDKLSKLFSENALDVRLVPLNEMLVRFKRLIYDLSKHLKKEVNFEIIGGDTELDKNIIDHIGEPVMHLIRNSIDHGVELPEKRRSKGKADAGTIRFEAVKSGNFVHLSISDDGNGIDTDYVYNKAVEQGFIESGAKLTEKEIFELIFLPGFSTAESLSDISGRGVGMDIVRKKIQEMRGEITIISKNGIGTTFQVKLQQSVSIIETLLIESEGMTYALPIEDIDTCRLDFSEDQLNGNSKQLGYNGRLIPFISLRDKFSCGNETGVISGKVVVINKSDRTYAIVVDKIIGEYQAVVKPLGAAFANQPFLSGASLLGDGSIALLLDTEHLWGEIAS